MAILSITREPATCRQFPPEFRDRNDLDVVGGIGVQAAIDDGKRRIGVFGGERVRAALRFHVSFPWLWRVVFPVTE